MSDVVTVAVVTPTPVAVTVPAGSTTLAVQVTGPDVIQPALLQRGTTGPPPTPNDTTILMPLGTYVADGTDQSHAINAWIAAQPDGIDEDHRVILQMPDNAVTGKPYIAGNISVTGRNFLTVTGVSKANPWTFTRSSGSGLRQTQAFKIGKNSSGVISVGVEGRYLRCEGAIIATQLGQDGRTYARYNNLYDAAGGFLLSESLNCRYVDCSSYRCQGDGFTVGVANGPPGPVNGSLIRVTSTQCGRHGIASVNHRDLYIEDYFADRNGDEAIDVEPNGVHDVADGLVIASSTPGATHGTWWNLWLVAAGAHPLTRMRVDGVNFDGFGNGGLPIHCASGRAAGPHSITNCTNSYHSTTVLAQIQRYDGGFLLDGNVIDTSANLAKFQGQCTGVVVTANNTPRTYTNT